MITIRWGKTIYFLQKKKENKAELFLFGFFFSYKEQSPFARNENEDGYEFCPRDCSGVARVI